MANRVDDYIAGLDGWQAEAAAALRRQILAVEGTTETFKWGQPVYESEHGPVCLLKAHKNHLTLGFWRGQQMEDPEGRFAPVGSFRMADIKLRGAGEIAGDEVRRLVEAGVALNRQHGNPLADMKK